MKKIKYKFKLPINKNAYIGLGSLLIASGASLYFINSNSCRGCVLNENGIKITSSDLSSAVKSREIFYRYNKQEISADVLKNDVLKQLKEEKKVQKYAKENNIKVTEQEVDALYKERIKQNQDEPTLLKKVNDLYGFTKKQYLEVLEQDILREKVQEKLDTPIAEWLNK